MGAVHGLKVVTFLVLALALAACASATPSSPDSTAISVPAGSHGVITGFADSCSGLMEQVHVKVRLYSGRSLVASETIRSGARFRFSVRPGAYEVMADHRSDEVAVTAGHTVSASLLMVCL
jgi:hypothetical protein